MEPIGEARGKVFESTAAWLEVTQEEGAGRGEPPHEPEAALAEPPGLAEPAATANGLAPTQ